jgi:hypothetical protein
MQIAPTFMPTEPTNLEIEVQFNQDDGTFQTNLFCDLNRCGRDVTIVSNGPKTPQNVRCVVHGLLTCFPDQTAFREFVRFFANKILTVRGHELIEPEATCILGDNQDAPESMN